MNAFALTAAVDGGVVFRLCLSFTKQCFWPQLEILVADGIICFCMFAFRESVESKAVRQAIDCFSNNVKDQLSEKVRLQKSSSTL